MLQLPYDREISGTGLGFDIEENAHNLLLLSSARLEEKEIAIRNEEEQKTLLNTLRENRNEVLLDTNLLEKKIVQEKKSIENVFNLAERIQLFSNDIKKQLCVSGDSYGKFEIYFKNIEKIRESFEAAHTEYMKVAVEAENNYRMLEIGRDRINQVLKVRRDKCNELLRNINEGTSQNKGDVSRLLSELFMKKFINDTAYLQEDSTLLGAVAKLRKVYVPLAEKNNLLKKSKAARDNDIRKNKEKIIEENAIKEQSFKLIQELKEKKSLKELELTALREEKDKLVEIFNSKCNLCVESDQIVENKNKLFNDLEIMEDNLVNEEVDLKLKYTNIEKALNESKQSLQEERKIVDEKIGSVESKQLLFKGRILEVSQQIEQLNSSLEKKKAAYNEKENEWKALDEKCNKLKTSRKLEKSNDMKRGKELDELLNKLRIDENNTLKEIKKQEALFESLKSQISTFKINLEDDQKKKNIGEQAAMDKEKSNQKLKSSVDEMIARENKLKNVCTNMEQYDFILKEGEVIRLEMKQDYDTMSKELAEFEENINKEIEEKQKDLLQTQDEAQKQKDEQTLYQHFIEYKTSTIEQGEVEIMRLKELLREFDHNLAKSIKSKQQLALQLANKNKPKNDIKTYNKKKQPELKTKEVTENKVKLELDSSEYIFSETDNIVGSTYSELPAVVKEERVDNIPEPVKTAGKKFFKSRVCEPKRSTIYSQIRNKKPKAKITDAKKTVFDYDDEEDLEIVFEGIRR